MQEPEAWETQYPAEGYSPEGYPPLPHSGLGIASFIIALVAGALLAMLVIAAGVMAATAGGGFDETAPATVALGCTILLAGLGHLVGTGLGIAGVVQRDRRKVFAVLGLVLNGLAILSIAGMLLIGIAAGTA